VRFIIYKLFEMFILISYVMITTNIMEIIAIGTDALMEFRFRNRRIHTSTYFQYTMDIYLVYYIILQELFSVDRLIIMGRF